MPSGAGGGILGGMRSRRLPPLICAVLLIAAVAAISTAQQPGTVQQPGVHPVSGRVFAQPMGVAGADWLDRRERELEEDPDLAMQLIRVAAWFGGG